ncbi:MAG: tRNA 2-thiouridine(34) synthase MnmA [Candidatus Pacebacteria bacterium]|nr:tRNA 2-thiouridine(34) synthase MnmA [Candidatus Paceibacterota bacterium]
MNAGLQGVRGKRIFVGLSGGVDSAVTALLLKQAGAEVTGVFIKGWYPPGMPCTWADDRRDAMRTSAHLGTPFHTLDASAEYKKSVIDYLLAEYAAGRTPNPDIMCNRDVKFGAFYDFARANGAEFIATGHYARAITRAHTELRRGIDPAKDQSYFLWAISQDALDHTIFPLGGFEKGDVRRFAEKHHLPVAMKRDSQGICFLGSISVDDFLRKELHPEAGEAIDEKGTIVGMHDSSVLYTLGQRVALRDTRTASGTGPWYVVRKDLRTNTLTVSHTPLAPSAHEEHIRLIQTNWLGTQDTTVALVAQYRYHGPIVEGHLDASRTSFIPRSPLDEPVAAGQSLVIYQGDHCLGGGIIA